MEHPRIDDERIVDRYLVGRLPSEDEALFEEHLFECADCLGKVQWGEELRRGLRAVAAEDAARANVSRGLLSLGLAAWLRSRRPARLAGVVGLALIFALMLAVVLWQQAELHRVRGLARQAASAGSGLAGPIGDFLVVSLGVVRGGGVVEIRPDPEKEAVLLSLELPTAAAAPYRVALHDANGEVLWRGDDLMPSLYDTLTVVLPSTYLAAGSYRITVEGRSAAGAEAAGEVEFRVLAEK